MSESDVSRISGALATLTALMAAAPAINYAISAAAPELYREGLLSAGELALIPASTFVLAAFIGRTAGPLTDRLSFATQTRVLFVLAALSLAIGVLATGLAGFLSASVIAAPAQALCNSVTNRAVASTSQPDLVPRWTGIKQSGVQGGQFVVGVVIAVAAATVGWRTGFAVLAVAVVVVIAVCWEPVGRLSRIVDTSAPGRRSGLSLPTGIGPAMATTGLSGFAMQSVNVYLALFVVSRLRLDTELGAVAVAGVGVCGVIGRTCIARGLARGWEPQGVLLATTLLSTLVPMGLWVVPMTTPWLLWVVVAVAGVGLLGVSTAANTLLIRVCGPSNLGAASGRLSMWMYSGFAAGPIITGAVLSATGSYSAAWTPSAIAIAASVGCAVVVVLRPPAVAPISVES